MKIVVYCYITNNIKNKSWPTIKFKDKDVDYVMFTDDVKDGEVERDGWKLRKVQTETKDMSKEDMNKLYKWHPYDNFEGYDYSLYIDSKVILLKSPIEIVQKFKDDMKYGFMCHRYDYYPKKYPEHNRNFDDIYKHIDYLITVKVGNLVNLQGWKQQLVSEGYPKGGGLLECAVILSDLKNETGKIIQDDIYKKYKEVNTARDQVVVPYVLWKKGININDCNKLGNYSHKSIYAENVIGGGINNRDYTDNRYKVDNKLGSMLVVTLTSWVKRIGNVKTVVESVMNNSLQPDRVYLNLSKIEFDGKSLPEDLIEYFNSDERLIINWVDGRNTKTMKKVFPILKYLKSDDIIINIDDDALIPKDFIKNRYDEFIRENNPITSCNNPKYHYVNNSLGVWSCGAGSIFQKKMLNGYEVFMNEKLVNSYNDDWCYTTLLWLNGYKFKSCSSYSMQNGSIDINNTKLKKYNDVEPMGKKHEYIDCDAMYKLLDERIKELYGISFEKAFGIIKKTYDCIIVYSKSKEMICGNHKEIEYVVASLKRFCKSWCGRIFIVGSNPPDSIKNDVIHISCLDPYTHCKDANIIHKIKCACEDIPDLSEDFLVVSDDQIVTHMTSWDDLKPRILRKYTDWTEEMWNHNKNNGFWHQCLYDTLNLFPKDKSSFWEPHIWSPMNKKKFLEMCEKYDYAHKTNCVVFSLYYNFIGQNPLRISDHIHLSDTNAIKKINNITISNVPRHLSWTDKAFEQKKFRDMLDEIVGFEKEPSNKKTNDVERKNKNIKPSTIQSLRIDISLGKVVRVPSGNGYIWKRVKK